MNNKFLRLISCLVLIIPGCQKDYKGSGESTISIQESNSTNAVGATQISGVGFFATNEECNSQSQGATYAVRMTGDLAGCLYVFIDEFECSPSGTYREEGRELFVGTYNGQSGTFWTVYKFEAKYEGCAANGSALGAEIFGRCQHIVVEGSGTGDFEGVTGRLDFKDDIEAGNFPYSGHLRF
jgi:hypothetical protein